MGLETDGCMHIGNSQAITLPYYNIMLCIRGNIQSSKYFKTRKGFPMIGTFKIQNI